ncbi:hypothetical protein A3Q56_06095 [Intoshia linei]|uniref:GRAM domain-containing protein n=1 Tax=Intoshia linei TaxID=1819745 RepID=A0A177AWY7_9BILA|nr:hypothetical protein A3Q56_06095 [Intoshia linei]
MSSISSHSGKINVNEKEIYSDHEHYKFLNSYFYRKFSSDVERSEFNISHKIKKLSHSSNESDNTNTLVNDFKLPVTALEMPDKDCSTNNLTVNNKNHEKSNSSCINIENYEFDSTIQTSVIDFSASSEKKIKKFMVNDYSRALSREILIQGQNYISVNTIYFYAKILGWETAFRIKMGRIISITKEKTDLFIPNAVQIKTRNETFFFAYFTSGDKYKLFSKSKRFLLRKQIPADEGKICAIIDLDETLVHSSFKFIENPDMIIPIEVDGIIHSVYVRLEASICCQFYQKNGTII